MSVRSKVNVVSSVPYPAQLRRFISDGKDETSAGILNNGSHAWIAHGDKLSVLYAAEGVCPRLMHSFSEDTKDPVDITCVEELVVDYSNRTPLLLVGTSSLNRSQLCVYNPATFKVIRAIELDNLQVRCMAVVDDGSSSLNSLTDVLAKMEGVVALGCSDGSVVLVDLNRETIIKAYQGNMLYSSSESTPHPVKFVADITNEERSILEIEAAQNKGDSAAISLIEGDDEDTDAGVTALSFSKETACLYVGYSSGLWQILNLSMGTFSMMYECAECTSPVANFCLIEPCEDPRPTVYLWVNHEGTESTMPLFNMYTLSYETKHFVNDYGTYYQDFISCVLSFSMFPGEEFSNVVSGRLVSAASYSRTIQRTLIHNMGLPPLEGIQLKLVITAFSLTFARGSTHTYLCIFDLDQWYKEQMPQEPDGDASYIETIELNAEPLIASAVQVDTISLYHTEEPQEIHLVPQAFSFKVLGLSESGLINIEKVGLQKLWLANTRLVGATSLVQSTKLFHACVSAGLVPTFPAHLNSDSCVPTNEEMRSYILSVCLENGLVQVILDVGEQWETGVHAAAGCTLSFLFDWVWSTASSVYKVFNQICDTVFSASGHEIDLSLKRRMQQTQLILNRLHSIHSAFCSKYNNPLYKATLEQRFTAIDIIVLFVQQVSWFTSVSLLPEPNSKGLPESSLRYEYLKLDQYANERRQHLNAAVAKFKKAGKLSDSPSAGLYLIDHFVHDYGQLSRQWEEEGGTAAYPPPSVQSLLRSLRLQSVPTPKKLAIVQYALLDIVHLADKAKFEDVIPMLERYSLLPKVNDIQTKIVKGLWHLDHGFYEEGMRYLLERTIKVSDLSEGLHRAILRLLLVEGKAKLALRYLRIRTPRLLSHDDVRLEMSLLLANKSTSDAYHFQRTHSSLRGPLLRQLIAGCLENGEIVKLINFPLDENELKFFDEYFKRHSSQRNDDLRILLLLTRSKYNEAKELHEQLVALNGVRDQVKTATREMIVNGFVRTLCPIDRDMYRISRDPRLTNLPEYKSSKPRPLSVYVKTTIDENGFPDFKQTNEQLCASTIACTANLARFNGHSNGLGKFEDIFEEETEICEDSSSIWDSKLAPGVKRAGNWASSSNKRQRLDDDDAGDDIAAFVGTPLVKRRSRELPGTPSSQIPKSQMHSILKSGKTPGTPSRAALGSDETETPKKTLRWDIPSETLGKKPTVKKSLLLTPTKEVISSSSTSAAADTPQDSDSIKNRLRSHTGTPTSVNKKGMANWNEIAEDAKAKVLFSLNLPPKKEKLPPQPQVGPSFVQRLNEIINEEKIRRDSIAEKITQKKLPVILRFESSPAVDANKDKDGKSAEEVVKTVEENDDVGMEVDATPSPPKKIKFLDVTLSDDEKNLLNISGSPFTTRTVPREIREQLRAQFQPSRAHGDHEKEAERAKNEVGAIGRDHGSELVEAAVVAPQAVEQESEKEELEEDVPVEETNAALVESPVESGMKSSTEEKVDASAESGGASPSKAADMNATEELTSSVTKDNESNVFSVQPQIATKVVSLSRSHYDDDEDEVGSEDPEEAEIPPVIEFSQPEEGLLIDASYSLKEPSNPLDVDEMIDDPVDEEVQAIASAVQDAAQNDSGSSVICLDSDSEDEPPKEQRQPDFEGYNEDTYSFDSEDAPNSSRGRRSFFHDKYNTHQEESEDSPSPEYSSGEDEWKNSDVDLYNMDEIPENTMPREEVELEDEIFGLGRGLQKRKDLGSSESEEDDNNEEEDEDDEDEDEEDDVEREDIEDEEEGEEEESPKPQVDDQDDDDDSDVQEILSSEEEEIEPPKNIPNPKALLKEKLKSQNTVTEFESQEEPAETVEEQAEEEPAEEEPAVDPLKMDDEAQLAVNSLLGLGEPVELIEEMTEVMPATNEEVEAVPATSEMAEVICVTHETVEVMAVVNEPEASKTPERDPAKAEDVIDFNLSQGQMFFGSPDVAETCNKPPDRALFQWKTFSQDTAGSGAKVQGEKTEAGGIEVKDEKVGVGLPEEVEVQEDKMELGGTKEVPVQNEHLAVDKPKVDASHISTSEETLVLRLNESDLRHVTSPLDDDEQGMRKSVAGKPDVEPKLTETPAVESKDQTMASQRVVHETIGEEKLTDSVEEAAAVSSVETQSGASQAVVEFVPQEVISQHEAAATKYEPAIEPVVHVPQNDVAKEGPSSDMKSFSCQTTFVAPEGSPEKERSRMSFGCQAAMDTTKSVVGATADVVLPPGFVEDCQTEPAPSSQLEGHTVKPELLTETSHTEEDKKGRKEDITVSSDPTIIVEPPTPFKNKALVSEDVETVSIAEEERPSGEDSINPCDVAFVGDMSSASVPTTPRTPAKTPVRKSMRLARISTPGRALAPDDEVNVSDSVLDIAVLDPDDISDEKPVMVNKSMVTDKQGLTKGEDEHKRKSRKSSKEPHSVNVDRMGEAGLERKRSKRSSSVELEQAKKSVGTSPAVSKKSGFSDRDSEKVESTSKASRASSSEPERKRHSRASSVDTDEHNKNHQDRRSRASSAQSEDNESKESRVSKDIRQRRRSSDSDRVRRHSSAEPEAQIKQSGNSRRASSEEPRYDSGSQGSRGLQSPSISKRKRSVSSDMLQNDECSPPKLRKSSAEPFEIPDDGEYKKRRIRHSITEPLGRKKHQQDGPRQEPMAKVPRLSDEPGFDEPSTSSGPSRPRKSRSLHEYPLRRSARPSALESIQELPEDSPGRLKRNNRYSTKKAFDDISLSSMTQTRPLDISKWVALSKSQSSRARKLSAKGVPPLPPVPDKSKTLKIDLVPVQVTPIANREGSPTDSIASSASSKVLRSGRVIDEHTPTKRTIKASKRRVTKVLKLSSPSSARGSRSGRAVGHDDRLTDGDDDDASVVSAESSISPASGADHIPEEEPVWMESGAQNHEVTMDEILSSRRLTRHQRSLLETSMSRGSEGTPTTSRKGDQKINDR